MSIKFVLSNTANPDWLREEEFQDDPITIGRHNDNVICLEDPDKKVSRHHARIERKDGVSYLTDCESANFTFLNDVKIDPNKPYALREGDQVMIGKFLLEFHEIAAAAEEDHTVVFQNPLQNDVQELVTVLNRLKKQYRSQQPENRAFLLQNALDEAASAIDAGDGELERILTNTIRETDNSDRYYLPERSANNNAAGELLEKRREQLLDILVDAFIEISQMTVNFRRDFVNIDAEAESEDLHTLDREQIIDHLLDPAISEERADGRIDALEIKLIELTLHQKAMLDGYRQVLENGPRAVLAPLAADKIQRRLVQESVGFGALKTMLSKLPFYMNFKGYRLLRKRIRQLMSEDPEVFDVNVFRKLFVDKYMEKMSSVQQEFVDNPTELLVFKDAAPAAGEAALSSVS